MVDRISSYSNSSKLIENNLRLQSAYAEGQQQVSSGYKSDSYEGLSKDTSRILSLESDYANLTAQTENAELALERSNVTFDTLGTMLDYAQSFLATLNAGISGTTTTVDLQNVANAGMDQIESLLNTQIAGRYLFSGSATTTPPVDFSDPTFGPAVAPSVADTGYYQGNDYKHTIELGEGYNIDYGLTANDPIIEQIVRAYDLVRNTPGDQATVEEAYNLLESGLDDLAEMRASVSLRAQNIDTAINDNLDDLNLLDNTLAGMKEVDLAEVTIRLQEIQTQLEASYSLTATLLRLNLADYI
jgi:flagellar hook-associated protein 3 FlgL|tara:strand:- start:95512 stop:96414 length:903 start_codon:yes stop_codon:yes gene_type:complete